MVQRREPGVLVLAKELSAAIEKHVEDREYSPTYLISEIGAKLSRVLIAGVLDQLENRGTEDDPFYTARVIDPNGDFYYLQAGQYNPEGATALSKLEVGVPILCVGKVRARTPEDSERTYVSVQPEGIRAVSMDEVSHWAIKACDKLNTRINANKAFGNDDEALKKAESPCLILCSEDDVMYPFLNKVKVCRPDAIVEIIKGKNLEPDLDAKNISVLLMEFLEKI